MSINLGLTPVRDVFLSYPLSYSKYLGPRIEPVASYRITELVLHQNVRAGVVGCQAGGTGTRDCESPVHAGHLSIINPEYVNAVCAEIGTEKKLPGRMEYNRMWVG